MKISTLTERIKSMETFTAALSEIVKGTDDEEIKQHIRSFLAENSEAYRFFVVGREKTGRTTFFRNCFLEGALETVGIEETAGIREIRYGAMETVIQVDTGYSRRFSTNPILDGIVLYDIGSKDIYRSERAGQLAEGADAVLAVFSAENIQDDYDGNLLKSTGQPKEWHVY